MPERSTKLSMLVLGMTALLCSRALFVFIRDPEGPNLLVVAAFAALIYAVSLPTFLCGPHAAGFRRLFLPIGLQILAAAAGYFFLR